MIDKNEDVFLGENIKGLMMTLIAKWNMQMDEARADTEFASVRPADIRVFAQLRGRTMKLSQVHKEMGFSRQAAKQAIDRLVAQDMLTITRDPQSKRDKLVEITEKGQRWRSIAAKNIRQIETDISDAIGSDERETLRKALVTLVNENTSFSEDVT